MMRGYAETTGCRRQFLLGYFGEPLDGPAATATPAHGRAGADADATGDGPFPVARRSSTTRGAPAWSCAREPDRIIVLFDEVGYKTLSLAAVEGSCARGRRVGPGHFIQLSMPLASTGQGVRQHVEPGRRDQDVVLDAHADPAQFRRDTVGRRRGSTGRARR